MKCPKCKAKGNLTMCFGAIEMYTCNGKGKHQYTNREASEAAASQLNNLRVQKAKQR